MYSIGKRLRELRERAGRSQKEVAREIGKGQNFLSLVESGKRNPSVETLEGLARVFHCRVGDFFSDPLPVEETEIVLMAAGPGPSSPIRADEVQAVLSEVHDTTNLDVAYEAVTLRGDRILQADTLGRINRMMTLHEVHHTLSEYFDAGESWPKIAKVIGEDRALALKVWEMGRRRALEAGKTLVGPGSDMPPETSHVELALRILGESGVKRTVLVSTRQAVESLMDEVSLGSPDMDRAFWCHGSLTAHTMLRLLDVHPRLKEQGAEVPPPGVIFRLGLMLDVGILLMHLEDPVSVRDVWFECTRGRRWESYHRGEWRLYGRHLHAAKGADMMRRARWTALETEVTQFHHQVDELDPASPHYPILQCAHLADVMASLLVFGPSLTLDDLGLDQDTRKAVLGGLGARQIRQMVTDIVGDAVRDDFNQRWSWPGYHELLNTLVPSARARRAWSGIRRDDFARPYADRLEENWRHLTRLLIS